MRFFVALLMLCPLVAAAPSFAYEPPTLTTDAPSLASELPTAAFEIPPAEQEAPAAAAQPTATAAQPTATAGNSTASRASNIDLLLDRAIAQNLIAGGVVVIGNHEGILATAARGTLTDAAGSPAINEHTMFDVASLTKVIATAPAVMKLIDEGRIVLSDPVSRYLPEFGDGQITVLNLLTHTSGLDDFGIGRGEAIESVVRRAGSERNRARAGSRFHYADINFILLGEMVHRVSGQTLDVFCKQQIYGPLGAQQTMFLPPQNVAGSIAPTAGFQGGTVQDTNARHLGGVAGHAGLFSSAYDLSLYARMLLGSGSLQERCILTQPTFSRMTTPYYCNNGAVKRGLGWDMESPFSAPKGSYFSAASFGHTGYSGSSIWIDPQQDLYVIMLTRRVNYSNTHVFNQLRKNVSTVAAADFRSSDGAAAPAIDTKALTAQVLEAAYPAIQASVRKAKLSDSRHKVTRARHRGRDRVVAKSGRRGHVRLAKADTARGHKKKRLVRS